MKCKKIKTKHVFMKKIDGKKEYKVKPMLNKKKDTKETEDFKETDFPNHTQSFIIGEL